MKKILSFFLCAFFTIYSFCQPKNFQGKIVYKIDVTSQSEGVTANAWKKGFLIGDSLTVIIKDGNYKRSCGPTETEFEITKAYAKELQTKINVFKSRTKTKKTLFLTMITTYGIKNSNNYIGLIQNEITMAALFK